MSIEAPIKKKRKPLGERLISTGLLTKERLKVAIEEQKRTGQLLGEILVRLKFVTAEDISQVIASESDTELESISGLNVSKETLAFIPETLAADEKLIPIEHKNGRLTLAMVDPFDIVAIDKIQEMTQLEIKVIAITESEFRKAFQLWYGTPDDHEYALENAIKEADQSTEVEVRSETDAPIAHLLDQLIDTGVRQHATDIHIEPEGHIVRIRYRIDGILISGSSIPKGIQAALESRLKIMAGMNISEKRVPQDGRIHFSEFGNNVDIRASTLPGVYGENIVLRILDLDKMALGLEQLGFSQENLHTFKQLLEKPFGIVLVTGPTGSGKTTTLYSGLLHINSLEKNVMTLEDPVEYRLPLIRQSQINSTAGFTFPVGLKALLRQDPDVILVGEIRDQETVQMSIRAALTGHLVLSTLHTNDAASALPRLLDMGVRPYFLPSTIAGILAQRLVRKICQHCKIPYQPTDMEAQIFSLEKRTLSELFRGEGCDHCGGTGYKGRIAIYEILTMSREIIDLILKSESAAAISEAAKAGGMVDMREDGAQKVLEGLTTFSEISRVTERRLGLSPRKKEGA
ncbi:MAG: GspE/PulE family protein [Nitrospiria bacterium]